jgi:hypothetical protein
MMIPMSFFLAMPLSLSACERMPLPCVSVTRGMLRRVCHDMNAAPTHARAKVIWEGFLVDHCVSINYASLSNRFAPYIEKYENF